jgi:hypothetical protein
MAIKPRLGLPVVDSHQAVVRLGAASWAPLHPSSRGIAVSLDTQQHLTTLRQLLAFRMHELETASTATAATAASRSRSRG